MEVRLLWEQKPLLKTVDDAAPCYAVVWSPDGARIFCGIGDRVYAFDRDTGTVGRTLKGPLTVSLAHSIHRHYADSVPGHKEVVYCLSCSSDGTLIASGGADKTVIIWTSKLEGLVKYTHQESIQCLAFNPVTQQLASGATTDLGMWHAKQRSVAKHTVTSKILSLAWTADGQYLALGHFNGRISIRDAEAREKVKTLAFQRDAPAWTLAWSTRADVPRPVLVVGCWNGLLSSHSMKGETLSEMQLPCSPYSLTLLSPSGPLLIGGTDKRACLWSADGVEVLELVVRDAWVWSAQIISIDEKTFLAIGTNDGTISVYSLQWKNEYTIHGDWFAQRESWNAVSIQRLPRDDKTTVSSTQLIRHFCLHLGRLAVQAGEQILIYALSSKHPPRMTHRHTLSKWWRLVAVTRHHVYCTYDSQIQVLDLEGTIVAEHRLYAEISCIAVMNGPPRHETLLVGCRNGHVLIVRPHNSIPQLLLEHSEAIHALDRNRDGSKIAMTDAEGTLFVCDIRTRQKIWEIVGQNAHSVAWNRRFDDMLAFGSADAIQIKASDHAAVRLAVDGCVLGFPGSLLYTRHGSTVTTVTVSSTMHAQRYLEKGRFDEAYGVLCLASTEDDWKQLGISCLLAKETTIATKCFRKIRDMPSLDLVERLENMKSDEHSASYFAEVYCYLGRLDDAATVYAEKGEMEKALNVFREMKRHEAGQRWAQFFSEKGEKRCDATAIDGAVKELIRDQAQWSEQSSDDREAFELYVRSGDYERAFCLVQQNKWPDALRFLTDGMGNEHTDLLRRSAELSFEMQDDEMSENLLQRLDAKHDLVKFYCTTAQWEKAKAAADGAALVDQVCLAEAEWLIERDAFLQAADIYAKGSRVDKARALLRELGHSKAALQLFDDASRLYWRLASLAEDASDAEDSMRVSEIYCAYHLIHASLRSPFPITDVGTLFNASRYLAAQITNPKAKIPKGVRVSHVLYVLFKTAQSVGADRTAKLAVERLCRYYLPVAWQEEVQIETLKRSNLNCLDAQELHSLCYRCNETIEMTHLEDDSCSLCGAPFSRCFLTFERLPVVEFVIDDDVSIEDALAAIASKGIEAPKASKFASDEIEPQILRLDGSSDSDAGSSSDPFGSVEAQLTVDISLNLAQLKRLSSHDVLIAAQPYTRASCSKFRFFKIMDHSLPLCVGKCGHLFVKEEYQQVCLEQGHGPFDLL